MKKISLFILSVLLPLLSSAANSTLSIEPLTIGAGETKTMFIDLSNPDQQVTMVEFRMQLPQGLSVASGDNALNIAGRTNWQKHTLYSNEKDGLIHVMLASPTNALISGTNGALISVRLTASSTFSGGTITLKNQKIGSPDMTVSKPADYSYTLQTPSAEAEPYVVYNNGTLTFYCDNQRSSRVGTKYDLNEEAKTPGWLEYRSLIREANFDATFAEARPQTLYRWFDNCNSLYEIQNMNNLNTINVKSFCATFSGCTSLASIDLSQINTSNAWDFEQMFRNCESLTSLDLSHFNTDNVTNMDQMFSGCISLTHINLSSFNTAKVRYMSSMFKNCVNLVNVNISHFRSNNIISIGEMFYGCSSLTSIDLSGFDTSNAMSDSNLQWSNLSSIFKRCSSLTDITFSNKFVSKDEQYLKDVFSDCHNLKTVTFTGDIPYSIHSKFFEGVGTAAAPATLDVPAEYRDHYAAKMNGNMFFGGYFTLSGGEEPGTDIISFADPAVKQICVSNWDTNGDGELSKAEAAAVTEIGTVFQNNKDITSFDEFQYFIGVKTLAYRTFYSCSNLKSVKLPNSITEVEGNAIYNCRQLSSISFPDNDGLTLSSGAISSCHALTTVYLPKNTMIPGGNPFHYCSSLTAIEVDAANANIKSVDGVVYSKNGESIIAYPCGKNQTEYTVLSGTKIINYYAFYYCRNLLKVTLPSSVEEIRIYAFSNCDYLATINIPNSVWIIAGNAFSWCYKLASVTLPSSLKTIGQDAFWCCDELPSISIPASVTFIGTGAFAHCISMESIVVESGNTVYDSRNSCNAIIETSSNKLIAGCKNTVIPSSVTSIGDDAFRVCTDLTSITIPNSITSIGNWAFGYCYGLTSITIPASVSSIGNYAFYGCNNVKEVRSLIAQPFNIDKSVFQVRVDNEEKFTSATLYVPKGTKSLYQQTDGWKNFQTIMEMEDGPEPGKKVERRTVVEEGTGTWCGYCPRGMAFMKKAEDTYGDRFIGIAIHGDDPMDIGGNGVSFTGYPTCFIDRTGGAQGIGLDVSIVGDALAVPTDIDVTVTGTWNADRTQVTATSTTEFLSAKQGCRVVYALTADGLRHSSWKQSNYYSGSTSSDPYMKPYTEAPNPITDIEFNHVLVASSYSGNTNQASPFSGSISAGDKQQNSYTLTLPTTGALAEAINKDKVYVVAMVLNPDGTVANAAKAKVIAGGQPNEKTGDLSGDGELNSTDLVMMVNMIMGNTEKTDAADLNGDGVLNSTDLVMLVNMIMGQ